MKDLKPFIKQVEPIHPTSKDEVVPMKILFKDEKQTDATVDILTQLTTDAKLCGEQDQVNTLNTKIILLYPILCTQHNGNYVLVCNLAISRKIVTQVIVGDQLTCNVIRISKVWRQSEPKRTDRLEWAKEVPG